MQNIEDPPFTQSARLLFICKLLPHSHITSPVLLTHTTVLRPSCILSLTTRLAGTRKVKAIWIYWSKR